MRTAEISRDTRETRIYVKLDLDGKGRVSVDTGVGFFNHMLELFGVHSGLDLTVRCEGDTDVDFHHSVEDVGICLGKAFKEALGDKTGIARFADRVIPMDECAALVALDISGRPFLNFEKKMTGKIGEFDAELVEEFMRAFAFNAGVNLYIDLLKGGNMHHEAEAVFKALAKCVQDAVKIVSDRVPSSKGVL
ncbi:MAG TPA: imidazoleglycerol-phosphate dehydratase HisB [Candidatus Borkfalkia avistercoris]|uniref:Imidazoleglycerol-phosphate dehydratase n=1 Tax=Candidatus Borkfalkia avistercoris TaxID=2838504 RepID=A0A9D2A819_9FIRM|nr:imidazoleglycerol-phosphate dehydratase HisB [Candidatus Borkfalkia avistercoris]